MRSIVSLVLSTFSVCVLFLAPSGYAQWIHEDDGCVTPTGANGHCITISQCKPMVDVLKTLKRPIPQTIVKKIKAFGCDGGVSEIKVCCPLGPIIIDNSSPAAPTADRDGDRDVSSHRNLYLLPKNCGYLDTNNKIVNGKNAYLNEFPWMALLRYRSRRGLSFNCGGTIINKNYILTAAHCISPELVSVRVGEYSIKNETDCETVFRKRICNPPVQDLTIEEVIQHSKFGKGPVKNDIGLIRVSEINLNVESARPVCLPVKRSRRPFTSVTVTGWGITNPETKTTSDILQKVDLPIVDQNSCSKIYQENNVKLTETQICAGGVQNKDSCLGDSGGPMMVATLDDNQNAKYIQQGIVSFGPSLCGLSQYPGVYTRVDHFMNWILDNIKA